MTLCNMDTQLEQLASQIWAELQAVRELEGQIDPEDVDGLQTADSHDSGISPPSPLEFEQQGLALRARKHKKRKRTDSQGFSLQDISEQLAQVLADPSQQRVELGVLKKSQARQVNALAAVYRFESRSCGRKGKTLFKKPDAGPLTQQGQKQVQQLLACSFSAQTEKQGAQIVQQQTHERAAVVAPLNSSNRGHMLLTKLGWSSGTGLGRKCQGIQDPLLPEKRARRAGLGT